MDKLTDYDLDKVIDSWEFENHPDHTIRKIAVELKELRAENARLRDNEKELLTVAHEWMQMHDALKAKYEPSIAVLSTPSTQAENVSKNSGHK